MTRLIQEKNNIVISLQRRLIGSSIQNSSGVHWCGHRVRFNKIQKNVPGQIQQDSAKFPEKNPGSFSIKPDEVQQESGKASGKI